MYLELSCNNFKLENRKEVLNREKNTNSKGGADYSLLRFINGKLRGG